MSKVGGDESGRETISYKPIGYIRSIFVSKNGTPRQSGLSDYARASITLSKEIFNNPEHSLHNLQQFYDLWRLVKSSTINYDLWTKTVKLYDDKGFLHSVDGRRCVYKFGVNATDWKPFSHEVIMSPSGEKIQCSILSMILMKKCWILSSYGHSIYQLYHVC